MRFVAALGRAVLGLVEAAGESALLFWNSLVGLVRGPWYLRNWFGQMIELVSENASTPAVRSGQLFDPRTTIARVVDRIPVPLDPP